jgi:hypothetical protein
VGRNREPDDALEAERPAEPAAKSYRLLAMLSIATVAAVVLVPYAGLPRFGQSDRLRTDDAASASVEHTSVAPDEAADDDLQRADEAAGGDARLIVADPTPTPPPTPPPSPPDYSRPIPTPTSSTPPPSAPEPSWADSRRETSAGYIATDVGCADSDSAEDLDEFFRERMGPVLGHDYQHVYPLGGDRHLWLFQDTFIDQPGFADELDETAFAHNAAFVQTGRCFTLYHRGTETAPTSFEPGTGEQPLSEWFWPLGGELVGDRLSVFWAEMTKDPDPGPGDGLGWHPVRTWLATYDAASLARLEFVPAPNSGVAPIYGYAVASDGEHTYLFGNTYDQNLARQGGWWDGPHSATTMWLARVPLGALAVQPEYRTARGWSADAADARPIASRFWAENPMQPRFLGDQWVAATKEDGFWGEELFIDVAVDPWGPWTTVSRTLGEPRGNDPLMNTYHAHLLPWLEEGSLVVSMSQNARDMVEDAFPHPERYRLQFRRAPLVPPPPPGPPTSTSTTTTTTTTTTHAGPPGPPPSTSPPTTTRPPRPTTSTSSPTTTTRPPRPTTTTTPPPPTTDPCATTTTTTTTSPSTTTSTAPPSTSSTTTTTDPCATG